MALLISIRLTRNNSMIPILARLPELSSKSVFGKLQLNEEIHDVKDSFDENFEFEFDLL